MELALPNVIFIQNHPGAFYYLLRISNSFYNFLFLSSCITFLFHLLYVQQFISHFLMRKGVDRPIHQSKQGNKRIYFLIRHLYEISHDLMTTNE